MLTDTTFWIDLLGERSRRQPGPAARFIAKHRAARFRVSIITWGELAVGFASAHDLALALRGVRLLFLPQQVAWEASRIEREIAGQRLGENDNWIAATARVWGLRLVTRDTAFARVPRLSVLSY
jgi:predicted nucleic acid-binding protein